MNLSPTCPFSDAYCVCPLCAQGRYASAPVYGLSPVAVLTGPNRTGFWADDEPETYTFTTAATDSATFTLDALRQVFSEMAKAQAMTFQRDILGTTSRVPDTLKDMVEE